MGCEPGGSRKFHGHDGGRGLPLCCRTCLPLSAPCSHQHQVPHTECWSWVQWEAMGARTSVPVHGGMGHQHGWPVDLALACSRAASMTCICLPHVWLRIYFIIWRKAFTANKRAN